MENKILLLTVFILIGSSNNAMSQINEKDIVMVSYEQSWLDYDGTLSLKNNTDVEMEENNQFKVDKIMLQYFRTPQTQSRQKEAALKRYNNYNRYAAMDYSK